MAKDLQTKVQADVRIGKGLSRTVHVVVPAAEVTKIYNARVEALAKTMKIDGFRPGHVPAKVVREKGGHQLGHDVAEALIQTFLPPILVEHKLNMAGQPHVHAAGHAADDHGEHAHHLHAHDGQDFAFEAHLEVFPEVSPKGYQGLKLDKAVAEPTEELVNVALERLQNNLQNFGPKDGKAAKGDRVTMTGQGFEGGKAFAGGKLSDFKVVLGSGQLIPGFEDGLIGAKAGDEVDLQVTFPADYHAKELAGKPATFKLTIDAVEAPQATALDDASAKQFGFDNLDALKDALRKGAVRDLAAASEQRVKRLMLDQLETANVGFDLPQSLVGAEHQALWRAQLNDLRRRGLGMEALGEDIEAAVASLRPLAERRVRLGLTLAVIAKEQQIQVTDEDIQAAIREQAQQAGGRAEEVLSHYKNPQNRQALTGPLLEDKVTSWVLGQATITEKPIDARELLNELQ
jgi:trigger factor